MPNVNDSLLIGFQRADRNLESPPICRIEESNRTPPDENTKYFRVHGDATIRTTSGTVNRSNSNLRKNVVEQIAFQNSSFTRLSYPDAEGVRVEVIGRLLRPSGSAGAISCRYDAGRGGVVASGPCYGVVEVTYRAPYDLWLATFSGTCPSVLTNDPPVDASTGSADDDQPTNGRDTMLVMGYRDDEVVASASLSPPPCPPPVTPDGDLGYTVMNTMEAKLPTLKIEIDPKYPPKLRARTGVSALSADCRIRVYPRTGNARLEATNGTITRRTGEGQQTVKDSVMFNGTPSGSLTYISSSFPNATPVGSFIDIWGRSFTPTIRLPGQAVRVVQWLSATMFINPADRILGSNEVAVVDLFGNAIPCFGALRVEYATTYEAFDYVFEYDATNKVFLDAHVLGIARATGREPEIVGTLKVSPPSLRGIR